MTVRKISDKESEHVLKVWDKSEMKTMKDYHNLYLKCDVLFLANIMGYAQIKILWVMPKSLFECMSFKLGYNAQ